MHYEHPITRDFRGVCELTDEASYRKFRAALDRRRRARITLRSVLLQDGERAGSFEGDFVVLAGARPGCR
jgi:thioesterase domain-containing protein